tara:strand:+ start:205 stop:768 length:564 start_codon:yes stop_codon:yes gene_type:complete
MNLSSIRLKQTLSARVASTGLQSSFAVGGTLNPTLTTTNADIAYGFSIKSNAADTPVKWTLDTHTLQQTDADTAPTSTETIGTSSGSAASILDVNGEAIPTAACGLAIYYEIPSDTANGAWVLATASSAEFCTVKLVGTASDEEEQIGVRSALLVPRQACASDYITFTFSASGVKINVVYLANTTFT